MDKFFLKSKTIWGGIVLALPAIVGAFGWDVPAETLAKLGTTVSGLIEGIYWLVGFVLVVWGRNTAKGKVTI